MSDMEQAYEYDEVEIEYWPVVENEIQYLMSWESSYSTYKRSANRSFIHQQISSIIKAIVVS